MNVRDARESDLGSLAELFLVVLRMHAAADPDIYRDISHEAAVRFLAPRLAESNNFLRVAESGTEALGFCSAAIRSRPDLPLIQPGEFLYVNDIVVRPGNRRRGVGRALVADLKTIARERGVSRIQLDVSHFNADASAFFRSQGFDVSGTRMSARVD